MSTRPTEHTSRPAPIAADAYASSGCSPGGPVIVLKFGSSVLTDARAIEVAVDEIHRERRRGRPVVAVVSALAGRTDELLTELARGVRPAHHDSLADHAARGDREAAGLLSIALDHAGVDHRRATADELGLVSTGPELVGAPFELDRAGLRELLDRHGVVLLPGFEARDRAGRTTLLGRGGSDLAAVFIAAELGAHVRLVKDVDGVFERDPRDAGHSPRVFARIGWEAAGRVAGALVQPRALELAARRGVEVEVAAPGSVGGTTVGGHQRAILRARPRPPILRVALAGGGELATEVRTFLQHARDRFELVGVLAEGSAASGQRGVAAGLRVRGGRELLDRGADVLVALDDDRGPALDLALDALGRGVDLVTTNRPALVHDGQRLAAAARIGCAQIRASAAVGGSAPVLERARLAASLRPISSFSGLLDPAASIVLDRLARGASLGASLSAARRRCDIEAPATTGYDRTAPVLDLILIARAAFGWDVHPEEITVDGIEPATADRARRAVASGRVLRRLARIDRVGGRLRASVELRDLPATSPFARLGDGEVLASFSQPGGHPPLVAHGRTDDAAPIALALRAELHDRWRTLRPPAVAAHARATSG